MGIILLEEEGKMETKAHPLVAVPVGIIKTCFASEIFFLRVKRLELL